jgi:hypothetical protein
MGASTSTSYQKPGIAIPITSVGDNRYKFGDEPTEYTFDEIFKYAPTLKTCSKCGSHIEFVGIMGYPPTEVLYKVVE